MSPVLFLIAALASPPEGPDPAATNAPIPYRVSVLEMEGLGWRQAQGDRLTSIRRPGSDSIWTAGRELAPVLARAAARTVHERQGVARPNESQNTGSAPGADDKLAASVLGRRLDQGILATIAIEGTWVATVHSVGDPGSASRVLVPEIARAKVEGEWLIPADGVLIVSLGARTIADAAGKAVVRERLAVIEVNPAEATAAACPVEAASPRPGDLPPLPEDIDLAPAPHAAIRQPIEPEVLPARHELADIDAGVDEAASGNLVVGANVASGKDLKLADQPAALPVPTPPGRSLPRAFTPDGSPAPSPPKADDDVKPTGGDDSAEPRPTPQAKHLQAKSVRPSPSTPPPAVPRTKAPTEPEPTRPLTLPEALRIGLENAPGARVLYPGGPADACGKPMVIASSGDDSPFQFRAEVMALVRSIEQQYWALGEQNNRRWSREVAVELGEEIFRREQARFELGRGSLPNHAEAKEQLERFRLDLAEATADVITTERQLRKILRLDSGDGRRLIPVTPPTEAQLTPDWDDCLARMLASQPDILRGEAQVRLAKFRPSGPPATNGPADASERERTFLQQVVHQTTHALARFFLEVDANSKQFQAAGRLREAAQQRLETQQAAYEAGTVTIDRYLDALRNWSTAVAREGQSRSSYNVSIIALEEAKGTLLSHDKIVVADLGDSPLPRTDRAAKVDAQTRVASLDRSADEAASRTGRADAPKTFTLRLPVTATTTVQVRISAGWVAGAARVLGTPAN